MDHRVLVLSAHSEQNSVLGAGVSGYPSKVRKLTRSCMPCASSSTAAAMSAVQVPTWNCSHGRVRLSLAAGSECDQDSAEYYGTCEPAAGHADGSGPDGQPARAGGVGRRPGRGAVSVGGHQASPRGLSTWKLPSITSIPLETHWSDAGPPVCSPAGGHPEHGQHHPVARTHS